MMPCFTLRTHSGAVIVSIFEALGRLEAGEVFEFENLAAHQRSAVVQFFASVLRVGREFGGGGVGDTAAWERLLATVPLDLTPPKGEPGLLQPVIGGLTEKNGYERIDFRTLEGIWSAAEHMVKRRDRLDVERAAFALIAGTYAGPGGRGHFSAARSNITSVLVSLDGTASSEIRTLAAAFGFIPGKAIEDHFLWSQPWVNEEALETLPRPFIGTQPMRLFEDDGLLGVSRARPDKARVTKGWCDDPHVSRPRTTGNQTFIAYSMTAARPFSHRFQHEMLWGSENNVKPEILKRKGRWVVRLCGVHPGTTCTVYSYHEKLFRMNLRPIVDDARDQLSADALGVGARAQIVLHRACVELHKERPSRGKEAAAKAQPRAATTTIPYIDRLGDNLLLETIRLAGLPDDELEDGAGQRALNDMAGRAVIDAFGEISRQFPMLTRAKAHMRLRAELEDKLKGVEDDVGQENSDHQKLVYAVLNNFARMMKDNGERDRHALRRRDGDIMTMAKYLAVVPSADRADTDKRAIWEFALWAVATFGVDGDRIGTALAEAKYPEDRMRSLLASTGPAFLRLGVDAMRYLGNRKVSVAEIVTFALTGEERIGLRIGEDYWRASGVYAPRPERRRPAQINPAA